VLPHFLMSLISVDKTWCTAGVPISVGLTSYARLSLQDYDIFSRKFIDTNSAQSKAVQTLHSVSHPKVSSETAWISWATNPAVWGPSTVSSRLEVQLHQQRASVVQTPPYCMSIVCLPWRQVGCCCWPCRWSHLLTVKKRLTMKSVIISRNTTTYNRCNRCWNINSNYFKQLPVVWVRNCNEHYSESKTRKSLLKNKLICGKLMVLERFRYIIFNTDVLLQKFCTDTAFN